jgi:hypothetical protein
VPSEGIGRIFLAREISQVFADAVKGELAHSGYQINQAIQTVAQTQAPMPAPVISGVIEEYALLEPGVFEVAASFTATRKDGTTHDSGCRVRHSEGVIEVMIKTAMRNCIQRFIVDAQDAKVF